MFESLCLVTVCLVSQTGSAQIEVGIAVRDITPVGPIWLSGYSGRDHASERAAQKLEVSAAAFSDGRERFVLVALDNCEVSREFTAPVLAEAAAKYQLGEGAVVIVSSHTHSAPCLGDVLVAMFQFEGAERERVEAYTRKLRADIGSVIGQAITDLKPAKLDQGKGRAGFAMNRRQYFEDRVDFGENPEGPVDHGVPVLRVSTLDGAVRAVLFGYACHGTTIGGKDWYDVSGDYMAFAREQIEAAFPGARALYLTGCGADSNPSPRGTLELAKQHGLELAGAVTGVLSRPMRPVSGAIRRAFARLELPLAPPPDRAHLVSDMENKSPFIRNRAKIWLGLLDAGKPLPASVSLPLSVIRIGNDLTFFLLGGEPVVDYALRIQREHAAENPWTVGYAFEVPCYIPSMRVLKEGGYEADSSLIYYGVYGPILGRAESMIADKLKELVQSVKQ